MAIWPEPGATGETLRGHLEYVANDLGNRSSQAMANGDIVEVYLKWAVDAADALRGALTLEDMNRLVLTPRYWATLANPADTVSVISAVNLEVRARLRDLHAAAKEITQQQSLIGPNNGQAPVYIVPDTNLLLHHPQLYPYVPWHELLRDNANVHPRVPLRIVLHLLVIDELDNAKRGKRHSRARQTLKLIYERQANYAFVPLAEGTEEAGEITVRVMSEDRRHVRLPRADDELVDRALALQSFLGLEVYFLTYDTGAALRATGRGLRAIRLEEAVSDTEARG